MYYCLLPGVYGQSFKLIIDSSIVLAILINSFYRKLFDRMCQEQALDAVQASFSLFFSIETCSKVSHSTILIMLYNYLKGGYSKVVAGLSRH